MQASRLQNAKNQSMPTIQQTAADGVVSEGAKAASNLNRVSKKQEQPGLEQKSPLAQKFNFKF